MKKHLAQFWSLYLVAITILTPYAPYIKGAIQQFLSTHGQLTAGVLSVLTLLAHWLPAPGTES